jgi:hypothetical protein
MNTTKVLLTSCLLVIAYSGALADERLKGIACRSVHLAYPGPEAVAFYNEVTPLQSADGTYFCVCGFNKGYYGMQELANGKKLLIFSVWDPGTQNDPKKVKDDDRVKMLHKDPSVRVGRFGNEGTGGQSFLDYEWKVKETYKFLVKSKPAGEGRVEFAGWFYHPEAKEWKHLISFSTQSKNQLKGYYSFIEDFRRNKISTTKARTAHFGNGWIQTDDGKWHELAKAQFTADSNPVLNINAKLDGARFWLGTGGELTNDDTKLRSFMTRPEGKAPEVPKE